MSSFFQKCQELLKEDGLMLLQSITISNQRLKTYSKGVDFIQKHIFPGGFLPSTQLMIDQSSKYTTMSVNDVEDIGLDYALTLKHWRERFEKNYPSLKEHGFDEKFYRLWKFYFEYCEGGFRERTISAVQVLFTGKGNINETYFRK